MNGDESTIAPVFIVGGSRTGSELIKNMIAKYTEIDMCPEMWMLSPKWLHKSFGENVKEILNDRDRKHAVEKLIGCMFDGKPFGSFWNVIGNRINREEARRSLLERELSTKSIFDTLMRLHAEHNNKIIPGAKFPVHYSYADTLVEWYPDCKIIHTMRDPRAVYCSQLVKHLNKANRKSIWRTIAVNVQQFVHISIQFEWTTRKHLALNQYRNYKLVRYEDLLRDPVSVTKDLCHFLGVPWDAGMAAPVVTSNTSFRDGRTKGLKAGFNQDSIGTWKKRLPRFKAKLFTVLHKSSIRKLGYSDVC